MNLSCSRRCFLVISKGVVIRPGSLVRALSSPRSRRSIFCTIIWFLLYSASSIFGTFTADLLHVLICYHCHPDHLLVTPS